MTSTLDELGQTVSISLRRLPYETYLCTIAAVCGHLRHVCAERSHEAADRLMHDTLTAVDRKDAAWLDATARRWRDLLAGEHDAGSRGVWLAFEALSGEVAGALPQYEAGERLTPAVVGWFGHEEPSTKDMLRQFAAAARLGAGCAATGHRCAPEEIRAAVFHGAAV